MRASLRPSSVPARSKPALLSPRTTSGPTPSSASLPGTAMLFVGFGVLCALGVWLILGSERRKREKLMRQIDASFLAPLNRSTRRSTSRRVNSQHR